MVEPNGRILHLQVTSRQSYPPLYPILSYPPDGHWLEVCQKLAKLLTNIQNFEGELIFFRLIDFGHFSFLKRFLGLVRSDGGQNFDPIEFLKFG